jgi:tetratricopeptide (TPR) repeat protein
MQNGDSIDQLEQLDQYLDGDLAPEQARELDLKLQQDEALRNLLDALILSRDAIRSHALRQRIHKLHKLYKLQPQQATPDASRSKTRFLWPLRVAAAMLIGLLGYGAFQFALLSPEAIYQDQYISYKLPVSRGASYQMNRLDSLFQNKSYPAVIEQFKKQAAPSRRDYFLSGIAYMEQGDFKKAIDRFQYLRQQPGDEDAATFAQESDYYMALAYLRAGELSKARTLLERIQQEPGHLYQNNVTASTLWELRLLEMKQH